MNKDELMTREAHLKALLRMMQDLGVAVEKDDMEEFEQTWLYQGYEPEYRFTPSCGFKSVMIPLSWGGPSNWIDTDTCTFYTSWGFTKTHSELPFYVIEYIDGRFAEDAWASFNIKIDNIYCGSYEDIDLDDLQKFIDRKQKELQEVQAEISNSSHE